MAHQSKGQPMRGVASGTPFRTLSTSPEAPYRNASTKKASFSAAASGSQASSNIATPTGSFPAFPVLANRAVIGAVPCKSGSKGSALRERNAYTTSTAMSQQRCPTHSLCGLMPGKWDHLRRGFGSRGAEVSRRPDLAR